MVESLDAPPAASSATISYWERSCARVALLWLLPIGLGAIGAILSPREFLGRLNSSALLIERAVSDGVSVFEDVRFAYEMARVFIYGYAVSACALSLPMVAVAAERRWLISSAMLWTLMLGFSLAGLSGALWFAHVSHVVAELTLPVSRILLIAAIFGTPALISVYALWRGRALRE